MSTVPMFSLYFHGPCKLAKIREVMVELACELGGIAPAPTLAEVERTAIAHPSGWHDDQLARTRWAGGGIELVEEVAPGPGNPRDGWGYLMNLTLEVAGVGDEPALTIRVSEADWDPQPKYVKATLTGRGLDIASYDRARELLRARLGSEGDRCDHTWIAVGNAKAMLDAGERELARTFLDRAIESDSDDSYWRERASELRRRLSEC